MNKITVSILNVYGQDKIYPVCDAAKTFANIAGTKTLTRETIALVQKLGYEITVQPQTVNF